MGKETSKKKKGLALPNAEYGGNPLAKKVPGEGRRNNRGKGYSVLPNHVEKKKKRRAGHGSSSPAGPRNGTWKGVRGRAREGTKVACSASTAIYLRGEVEGEKGGNGKERASNSRRHVTGGSPRPRATTTKNVAGAQ